MRRTDFVSVNRSFGGQRSASTLGAKQRYRQSGKYRTPPGSAADLQPSVVLPVCQRLPGLVPPSDAPLTPKIEELTRALEEEVQKRAVTRLLMTHPGVGPLTALAYELVIGTPERFHCGKQLASYIGLVPTEESSGDRRRLGHISKQGNVLLRFLLVEAAQVTVRSQPEWRSKFFHLAMRRGRKIAKVAMARKLAVHLYWMWRQGRDYGQMQKLGSHAGEPGHLDGVQSITDVMIGHPAPSK